MRHNTSNLLGSIAAICMFVFVSGCITSQPGNAKQWIAEFNLKDRHLAATGKNTYFVLEPGFQLVLEGEDAKVTITVLDETKQVAGIQTRVIEEKEEKDGALVEVSRNFFAICENTRDVFYFGEDVDIYKDGKITGHSGCWLAGQSHAKAGMIMPGKPVLGMKYYQEQAPGIAMDRAEVISLAATLKTPAGTFSKCLKTQEGSALNPSEKEFKTYAPGIGLIQDEDLYLARYGFIKAKN